MKASVGLNIIQAGRSAWGVGTAGAVAGFKFNHTGRLASVFGGTGLVFSAKEKQPTHWSTPKSFQRLFQTQRASSLDIYGLVSYQFNRF